MQMAADRMSVVRRRGMSIINSATRLIMKMNNSLGFLHSSSRDTEFLRTTLDRIFDQMDG